MSDSTPKVDRPCRKRKQATLCDRCQALEDVFEEFEKPMSHTERHLDGLDRSHQEIIPWNSISPDCGLCSQLSSLYKACANSSETADVPDLILKCRYWWHPDLARLVAFHRVSYRGKLCYVFLKLDGSLPVSIVDTEQADYERLRYWSRNCRDQHYHCRLSDRISLVSHIDLKVIDCRSRTICALPPHADYVCLSYVWGSIESLSEAKPGDDVPLHDLPKTIEDAMYVTLQLGINFLWVDRYCIDQQNPDEKHHMITNMDQIYQNGTFTIIAAHGNGPHAGLPGVRGTPRKPQRVIETEHLTLIGIENISRYVRESKWNTRGWTYQEMLLSRRILLFTDTRVYYQCSSGFGLEGVTRTIMPPRQDRDSDVYSWTEKVPGTKPVFPMLQGNLPGYIILDRLSEYFERSLSFPADTIRAVFGIFNALSKTKAFRLNHFYGMPVFLHKGVFKCAAEDFVERLTWVAGTNRPTHMPVRRLGDEYGTDLSSIMPGAGFEKRTALFPSWSWAAFKADCPKSEQENGIKLIFPRSHKQVDTFRSFDAADTEIRLRHCIENRSVRISNFVRFHQDFQKYFPTLDITAWTWNGLFSSEMLDDRLDAYNIALLFDDSHSLPKNRLTAIHMATYKTRGVHEEEQLKRRASGNPHERCYHIRMLLVRRQGFQEYARVGILTMDTMWRSDLAPGSVEDVLRGMMIPVDDESRSCWKRKMLRLV